MLTIKARLKALGKTQVWLIFQLRQLGITVQPPQLSAIVNGVYTYPSSKRILEQCDEILKEAEANEIKK